MHLKINALTALVISVKIKKLILCKIRKNHVFFLKFVKCKLLNCVCQKEAERLKEAARMNELLQQATEHHSKSLMKHRGWQPWRRLMRRRQQQQQTADVAFTKCCLRSVKHLFINRVPTPA